MAVALAGVAKPVKPQFRRVGLSDGLRRGVRGLPQSLDKHLASSKVPMCMSVSPSPALHDCSSPDRQQHSCKHGHIYVSPAEQFWIAPVFDNSALHYAIQRPRPNTAAAAATASDRSYVRHSHQSTTGVWPATFDEPIHQLSNLTESTFQWVALQFGATSIPGVAAAIPPALKHCMCA